MEPALAGEYKLAPVKSSRMADEPLASIRLAIICDFNVVNPERPATTIFELGANIVPSILNELDPLIDIIPDVLVLSM